MTEKSDEVIAYLIEVGGRMTRDLGLGRIVGQVLAYIYLCEHAKSLDDMESDLGLSKASVSIAARQLESFGLIQKVWKKGDKKHYYRLVKDLGAALSKGMLAILRAKSDAVGAELDHVESMMQSMDDREQQFVWGRLQRAQRLRKRVDQILGSKILKMLGF